MTRQHDTPRLAFVVFACPKSGTTWLQRLLCAHPALHCAEVRAPGRYLKIDPAYATPHIALEEYAAILTRHLHPGGGAGDAFGRDLLFDLWDTIIESVRRQSGKSVVGEKLTPFAGTEAHAVRLLHEYNPDLRFINLVRDGRDVAVSGFAQQTSTALRRASEPDAARLRERLESRQIPDDFLDLWASMWTACVDAGLEGERLFTRSIRVRYEDMLDDAPSQFARLLELLGVEHDDATIARCLDAASFERLTGGRERGREDATHFFRKGVRGDWANWLTPAQNERFLAAAGGRLDALTHAPARP
ncbi:MAG: sulfotransferase domain-containing protein [Phycisphaerales bacterium]